MLKINFLKLQNKITILFFTKYFNVEIVNYLFQKIILKTKILYSKSFTTNKISFQKILNLVIHLVVHWIFVAV